MLPRMHKGFQRRVVPCMIHLDIFVHWVTHIHMQTSTYADVNTRICSRVQVHTNIHTDAHIHRQIHAHTHTGTRTFI